MMSIEVTVSDSADGTAGDNELAGSENTLVKTKGGGGAVSPLWLLLGVMLTAGAALKRRFGPAPALRILVVAAVLLSLGMPAAAIAGEPGALFVGGTLGRTGGNSDRGGLNRALADMGYDAHVVSVDDTGTGYKMFVGYRFNKALGVEGGYLDLGEVGLTISGQFDDVDTFLDSARAIHPSSAAGAYLAGNYNWYLLGDLSLLIRAGVFFGKGDYSTTAEAVAVLVSDDSSESETAFFGGVGCQYDITSSWSLQAAWERFSLDGDGVDFFSGSLIYRFGWPFGK
jgi:opacity protein-like surface antigen